MVPYSICKVWFPISVHCAIVTSSVRRIVFEIWLQKRHDLENWVRGPSRSLEMSPFDKAHMTSYWRSIVNMALSRVVSEIFNVEKYRDFEIVNQGHWKWYYSIDYLWFPISVIVTWSLRRTIFEIFGLYLYSDLETRVMDHWRLSEPTRIDPPPMTSY